MLDVLLFVLLFSGCSVSGLEDPVDLDQLVEVEALWILGLVEKVQDETRDDQTDDHDEHDH